MAATILSPSSSRPSLSPALVNLFPSPPSPPSSSANPSFYLPLSLPIPSHLPPENYRRLVVASACAASQLCVPQKQLVINKSALVVEEAVSEEELWATACLRIRCFQDFRDSYGIEDHKRYLAECEFEALKERIAGEREGFTKVSCINASLPLSCVSSVSDDLCNKCKFSVAGEDRIVVGTLDVNNCLRLPDEIAGMRPEGIGADFARAYISNVCVAKELQRNGLGYELILKARAVAEAWGMSDLYVHVAVDNEPAKRLYLKSGFIHERDEPAWQARFLKRPQRILLWMGLPVPYSL